MTIVTITTYNRPELLLSLLKQLYEQPTKEEFSIYVFNDCSTEDYSFVADYLKKDNFFHLKYGVRHGKKKHFDVINSIFNLLLRKKFDYYIHLQDDVVLCDKFIDTAIEHYERIEDPKKISLYLHDGGKRLTESCWTGFAPLTVKWGDEDFDLIQWIDLCAFIVTKKFLEALNYHIDPIPETRWLSDPTVSSGVGRQISQRLFRANHLYRKPLVTHIGHKSEMHQ